MDWTLDNLMWSRGKYHFPESRSLLWLINLKNSFWKWRMLLVTFLCWKHVVKRQGYSLVGYSICKCTSKYVPRKMNLDLVL